MVTGAAGFIGEHLIAELREHGHGTIGVGFGAEIDFDLASDTAAAQLAETVKVDGPDVVVHAAALVGREFGEQDPANTLRQNVLVTRDVARACRAAGAHLVYLSSSEVYGDHDGDWVGEHSPTVPLNTYGWSKLWGEQVARAENPGAITVARLSMPYGPGHPPGRGRAALTNFLWQALHGEPIVVYRGGVRSWCWVGDTVHAIRLLVEARRVGVTNVGRDDDLRPMLDVARIAMRLASSTGRSTIVEDDAPPGLTEIKRLDVSRLRSLGWAPAVELEDGMQRTLDWLRKET
jgi:nucleoside-diphosphate-sugar epimerase